MTKQEYEILAIHLSNLRDDVYKNHAMAFDKFMSRLCTDIKQVNENFDKYKFHQKVYNK